MKGFLGILTLLTLLTIVGCNYEYPQAIQATEDLITNQVDPERTADYKNLKRALLAAQSGDNANRTIDCNGKKMSALGLALITEQYKTAKLLLRKNANVDFDDNGGLSNLALAANRGKLEAVKLLLTVGKADINQRSKFGRGTALMAAVESGEAEVAAYLLKQKADVNATNKDGDSALAIAALAGQVELCDLLLQNGASAKLKNADGKELLARVLESASLPVIKFFFDKNLAGRSGKVDGKSYLAWSAANTPDVLEFLLERKSTGEPDKKDLQDGLLQALGKFNFKLAEIYLKYGADPNGKTEKGNAMLLEFVLLDRSASVKFLLEHGASASVTDHKGNPLLLLAVRKRKMDMVKILVEKGVDLNLQNQNRTALGESLRINDLDAAEYLLNQGAKPLIAMEQFCELLKNRDFSVAELLLKKGYALNADPACPLLVWALEQEDEKIVDFLLKNNVDLNARASDDTGLTPVMLAVRNSDRKLLNRLLKLHADPNVKTKNGDTALAIAVRADDEECAETLLEYGARVDVKDKSGRPIINLVKDKESRLAELLTQRLAEKPLEQPTDSSRNSKGRIDRKYLVLALDNGSDETAAELIKKGCDSKFNYGDKPVLIYAIENALDLTATALIEHGSDLNVRDADNNTALLVALNSGNYKLAKLLLQKGAKVNNKGADLLTPLECAVTARQTDIVELMLDKGVDAGTKNASGVPILFLTLDDSGMFQLFLQKLSKAALSAVYDDQKRGILHYAAAQGSDTAVKMLLDKGLDVNAKGPNGNSALHFAAAQGHLEVLAVLVAANAKVNYKNRENQSALDIAEAEHQERAAEFLREHGARSSKLKKRDRL